MTELDARLAESAPPEIEDRDSWQSESPPPPEEGGLEAEAPVAEEPDVTQARSLLTELRPAGFGEVMVTDAWLPPEPVDKDEEEEEEEAQPRQRRWEERQEVRELKLLRETPLVSYDARTELYWGEVREAAESAEQAIIDPYTAFAASFADADIDGIAAHRAEARQYGQGADALLEVGRAYVVIGRSKSARGVLEAAAKADPFHPEVWLNLGMSHLLARANRPAVRALRRALDLVPGDFHAELALGVACYHQKDYATAEEHFRRLAGSSALRASARSMLACSLRMQEKWDDARVELRFLRDAAPGDWAALSDQCWDCVERGEEKRRGPLRARRRARQMWQSLAAAGAGGVWIAYSLAQDLFRKEARWAVLPLFLVAVVLARGLRGISGRELPDEFGNAEQGLPCWQTTTWMKTRRSEF